MGFTTDILKQIIDEAMAKRDRSVSIYVSPDGDISINVTPWSEDQDEK